MSKSGDEFRNATFNDEELGDILSVYELALEIESRHLFTKFIREEYPQMLNL